MAKNNNSLDSLINKYNPMEDLNKIVIQKDELEPKEENQEKESNEVILSPQEIKKVQNGATIKVVQGNKGKQLISFLAQAQTIQDIQSLLFFKNANSKNKMTLTSILNNLLDDYIKQNSEDIEMIRKFKSKF